MVDRLRPVMERSVVAAPALRLELGADRLAPERARRALEDLNHGVASETLSLLKLLAGELVTNSVVHSNGYGGPITMTVEVVPERVRVEVRDSGPGFALPVAPRGREDETGRGLLLVDRLADRWGVRRARGTCVWFELERTGRAS